MIIEKISSNHIILESGSVITYSNENEVLFSIKMDDSFSFDLLIKFTNNGEKKSPVEAKRFRQYHNIKLR